jgi:hypothetical protein
VEDAYRIGLEVRTAHEVLDPSTLITEPGTTRSQADVLSYDPSSQLLESVANLSPWFERSEKELPEALKVSHSQPIADGGSCMTGNDGNFDCNSHTMQCEISSENWDTDTWWNGYDLNNESSILDFNPK